MIKKTRGISDIFRDNSSWVRNTVSGVRKMAKKGMKRLERQHVHESNTVSPVPEIQGKAKHGKQKANPIVAQHMRLSAHRVMYIVANSRGMDGIDDSIYIVENLAWWQLTLRTAQWTLVGLTVLAAAILVLDIAKEKFPKKAAK